MDERLERFTISTPGRPWAVIANVAKIPWGMQGGTRVFGGRDRIVGGLLGAVVIASVANGLDLLGQLADESAVCAGAVN